MTKRDFLSTTIHLSAPENWEDYELLDSGKGKTLERFGKHILIRPEPQAVWQRGLPATAWEKADAVMVEEKAEYGASWNYLRPIEKAWKMHYKNLRFQLQMANSRHIGVFPEMASNWDWMSKRIRKAAKPFKVLNLFGYSGLATLACAEAGAEVTHVDASKHAISWANFNYKLSKLEAQPVRWIAEDALKFAEREVRRGNRYQGIVLDPPKFGRGASGEVWDFFKKIPELMMACRELLGEDADFLVITAYAIRASALLTEQAVAEIMGERGKSETGELVTVDSSAGHVISHAMYTRWSKD
ncbi:MAG: class I SAM-dependent methyltransferase [Anaerolineaceae bacterium]|nr:class I SAM-dependent methyltransferase [Anaerolineaceae bacterium]